jgi:phosphoribosyl 1,2-cyclic phosphodiesterase/ActR/RegA family two-component response regulator
MPAMKTVLIIDDDADYRSLMGEILKDQGWHILEADEGEKGIELARQHRPQAVLCDLLMPGGNGFQVCRAIRRDIALRHTKIIVTSGRDFDSDRQAAREAGADEYLSKPFAPDRLVELLTQFNENADSIGKAVPPPATAQPGRTRIKFWGVRGSIPTPGPNTVRYGGNTSCIEVRADGEIIILDAGTGLRPLGRELAAEFKEQPLNLTLLLTHTHWDHIQGLPFFQPIYQPQNRLRILGYEGARKGLVNVLSGQMESPYFPVALGQLPGNIEIEELRDLEFNIGPVRVQAWFANHPGICVGYRLFTADGSVAFFPDTEPHWRHRSKSAGQPAGGKAPLEFALGEEQKTVEFLRGTDVLILDAQYDCDEYKQHVGWGHGCVDDAVALALKAQVKQLFLFHHDPDHDDAKLDLMLAHARKLAAEQESALQVDAAREGAVVELAAMSRGAART